MDCETFNYIKDTSEEFGFLSCVLIGMLTFIIFGICLQREQIQDAANEVIGNSVIDNDGKILFIKTESKNPIDPGKVFYTIVSLNIGLRVILAVMAYTTNSHCKVRGGFTDVMLAFAGLIAYFMYYNMHLAQVKNHIRCLSILKLKGAADLNCTSAIQLLLKEDPTLFFNNGVVLVNHTVKHENKSFTFQRCEDVTDLAQLKRIEEQLNSNNPVLLKLRFSIICGDTETRMKYLNEWKSFMFSGSDIDLSFAIRSSLQREVKIDCFNHNVEMILWWDTERDIPWWMSEKWFCVFTILLLGAPYKFFFAFTTQRVTIDIKKVIYCDAQNNSMNLESSQ